MTAHWKIYKDSKRSPDYPWFVEHSYDPADEHFVQDHEYGSFASYQGALVAYLTWVAHSCDPQAPHVPYYGLELGINTPDGERECALDIGGFQHLEEAILYADTLRGIPTSQAMDRAERDEHPVSPMDTHPDDMHLPLAGATVYSYDQINGTTWSYDLLSWEPQSLAYIS